MRPWPAAPIHCKQFSLGSLLSSAQGAQRINLLSCLKGSEPASRSQSKAMLSAVEGCAPARWHSSSPI